MAMWCTHFLRRIVRQHHVPHRAIGARQRLDAKLVQKLAAAKGGEDRGRAVTSPLDELRAE